MLIPKAQQWCLVIVALVSGWQPVIASSSSAAPSSQDAGMILNQTIQLYLTACERLAEDDLPSARTALKGLVETLENPAAPFPKTLVEQSKKVVAATDIESVRGALKPTSAILIAYLLKHSDAIDPPVHIAFCPVSNGSWLQRSEEPIINPYHGKNMLHCGSIRQSLGTPADGAAKGNP